MSGWSRIPSPRSVKSKTDYEVSLEIAKKLGDELVEKYTWGKSVEDWMKLGWDTRELEPRLGMTWEEFKEKGFAALPYNPEWQKGLRSTFWIKSLLRGSGSQSSEDPHRAVRV